MRHEGINFRKRNDLTYRPATKGDRYTKEPVGGPIPEGHCVFSKKGDGELIPIEEHSTKDMAYANSRPVGDQYAYTVYLVHDGSVYTGTMEDGSDLREGAPKPN